MDIPRRIDLSRLSRAELAIRNAVLVVEEMPADALLTDAIVLLQQAKEKVADYVDKQPRHLTMQAEPLLMGVNPKGGK